MTISHRSVARAAAGRAGATPPRTPGSSPALALRGGLPERRRTVPLTRRFDVRAFDASGNVTEFTRVAPATPMFEDAFAAVARGTLISTAEGPVAVEDLVPGMMIETARAGAMPLLWLGAMTVYPETRGGEMGVEGGGLIRLSADAFGFGRPAPDLVLGPRSRILHRASACREVVGEAEAFAPAHAFIDGDGVIPLRPLSPVRVYHLALEGQHVIRANGLEVESYHPGPTPETMTSPETLELFMALFPHVKGPRGFGPMTVPRLTAFELESVLTA